MLNINFLKEIDQFIMEWFYDFIAIIYPILPIRDLMFVEEIKSEKVCIRGGGDGREYH